MPQLFAPPGLDLDDHRALAELAEIRDSLASSLRAPRRWTGGLRRTSAARAIRGSNTIEGYTVTDSDAAAAVDGEPPLSADEQTWAEITAYRRVMTYVLNVATDPSFVIDESVLRSMHFMLLEHDLNKSPGRYRTSAAQVHDDRAHDDRAHRDVYEGPAADDVPDLMRELARQLAEPGPDHPLVSAAMAHLNLVAIHPFRDGNGRMARALQTMVLAGDRVVEPPFSSIEEWLGANTQDYYDVLAAVARGGWHPDRDTALWVKFNLRAHHMQAQTTRRRFAEAERQWARLDDLTTRHRLPDRLADALFDALLGFRVTRHGYLNHVTVDERTATRDLVRAAEAGLLEARGERRGRYYLAGESLRAIQDELRAARQPLIDPYPTLVAEIRLAK
ncbi:MAG: Fic family protein [Actinomycetia bacterium]|nr:Fic family protein [Actinomycetes bacterium]